MLRLASFAPRGHASASLRPFQLGMKSTATMAWRWRLVRAQTGAMVSQLDHCHRKAAGCVVRWAAMQRPPHHSRSTFQPRARQCSLSFHFLINTDKMILCMLSGAAQPRQITYHLASSACHQKLPNTDNLHAIVPAMVPTRMCAVFGSAAAQHNDSTEQSAVMICRAPHRQEHGRRNVPCFLLSSAALLAARAVRCVQHAGRPSSISCPWGTAKAREAQGTCTGFLYKALCSTACVPCP